MAQMELNSVIVTACCARLPRENRLFVRSRSGGDNCHSLAAQRRFLGATSRSLVS